MRYVARYYPAERWAGKHWPDMRLVIEVRKEEDRSFAAKFCNSAGIILTEKLERQHDKKKDDLAEINRKFFERCDHDHGEGA